MLTATWIVFVTSFILVCFFIKKIVYIAHTKGLFDEPSESRKVHRVGTPNFGGVAIFGSFFITSTLSPAVFGIAHLNYIMLSLLLLFVTGLADDLNGMAAWKKMIVQVAVAFIISIAADGRFTGMGGLFGVGALPVGLSVILSALFFIFIINAFNLIDGIDCLAGGTGLMGSLIFSFYFGAAGATDLQWASIILAGCLSAFLVFNKTPARIFLGDSGSTFIGFLMAYFSVRFINLPVSSLAAVPFLNGQASAILLVAGILIVPVFDTSRVFYSRIARGQHPFAADRNHIHHRLLDLGFTHIQSTSILLAVNMLVIIIILLCHGINKELSLFVVVCTVAALAWTLSTAERKYKKRTAGKQTMQGSSSRVAAGKITILVEKGTNVLHKQARVPEQLEQTIK